MPRAGLTADRIALMGAELADEIGFDRVTLSEVARRAGVQVASLYSHVKGSDDLLTRIAVLVLSELADLGEKALAGRSGRDALDALGRVHRTYAAEHPGRYDASRRRLDAGEPVLAVGRRHSALLRAALRSYDLPEPAETHAVRIVSSVVEGFATLEASGGFDLSSPPAEESWVVAVDGLDRVLRDL